jgi:hypothetical protein
VLTHFPPQHWRPIAHAGLQAFAPLELPEPPPLLDPVVDPLPEAELPVLLPDPELTLEPLPPVDASPPPTNVEPPQREEETINPASRAKPRSRFQPVIIAPSPETLWTALGGTSRSNLEGSPGRRGRCAARWSASPSAR